MSRISLGIIGNKQSTSENPLLRGVGVGNTLFQQIMGDNRLIPFLGHHVIALIIQMERVGKERVAAVCTDGSVIIDNRRADAGEDLGIELADIRIQPPIRAIRVDLDNRADQRRDARISGSIDHRFDMADGVAERRRRTQRRVGDIIGAHHNQDDIRPGDEAWESKAHVHCARAWHALIRDDDVISGIPQLGSELRRIIAAPGGTNSIGNAVTDRHDHFCIGSCGRRGRGH